MYRRLQHARDEFYDEDDVFDFHDEIIHNTREMYNDRVSYNERISPDMFENEDLARALPDCIDNTILTTDQRIPAI